MNERIKTQQAMKKFVEKAREKGLTDNSLMNIGVICGSNQMYESGYTTEQAFLKATELLEEGKTLSELYDKLLEMSGYNPDEEK